ncbi:hypothetical protein [Pseudomonas sp. NFIX28]|uniref:hypothetical protein n=1 Tax=Pseudomonas sp. NFIX28 TaxID=1566235 RepID=UPI000894461F|nr:hypothetical protein [Pseudomonas sp. NFIX28]SDY41121.1 hypothetical protein SAMN03159453_00537 [Pseudomonas sp. NFIX28]
MFKHSPLVLAALLASGALMASAEDAHHPAQVPDTSSTESMAPAPTPTSTAMTDAMAEQMKKMQAAHDKAAAAKTPEERHAAMQEGMQALRNSMAMMHKEHGAMGCMGMPAAKDGSGKGMMDMMMKMMEQQSSMMDMPMKN